MLGHRSVTERLLSMSKALGLTSQGTDVYVTNLGTAVYIFPKGSFLNIISSMLS